VIADYPGSPFVVGTIIHYEPLIPESVCVELLDGKLHAEARPFRESFDKFPAIFCPLQWSEKRIVEDLPNYVWWEWHGQATKSCRRVIKWSKYRDEFNAFLEDKNTPNLQEHRMGFLSPATESEYLEYQKQLSCR